MRNIPLSEIDGFHNHPFKVLEDEDMFQLVERSFDNERADIHNAGRLQSAGFDNAAAAGSDFGQVRSDETEISQGTSQNPVLQASDELHPDTAFGENRADSDESGRNPDEADGSAGGL